MPLPLLIIQLAWEAWVPDIIRGLQRQPSWSLLLVACPTPPMESLSPKHTLNHYLQGSPGPLHPGKTHILLFLSSIYSMLFALHSLRLSTKLNPHFLLHLLPMLWLAYPTSEALLPLYTITSAPLQWMPSSLPLPQPLPWLSQAYSITSPPYHSSPTIFVSPTTDYQMTISPFSFNASSVSQFFHQLSSIGHALTASTHWTP